MASGSGVVIMENVDDGVGPLVATVHPTTGQVVIAHANATDPQTGAPIYDATVGGLPSLVGLLDGQVFGVDKKLIALGVLAFFLLKK